MIKWFNNFLKALVSKWLFSFEYDIILTDNGRKPTRAYHNDAGYDLYVSQAVKIPAGKIVNIPTGVSCKSKRSAWLLLTGRSSTLVKYGLLVNDAIIDGDYTGELFVKVYNTTKESVYLPPHTRIAQIIVLPHAVVNFNFKDKLPVRKNGRGNRGFGSSGK